MGYLKQSLDEKWEELIYICTLVILKVKTFCQIQYTGNASMEFVQYISRNVVYVQYVLIIKAFV